MDVKAMDCSWLTSPFWRRQFKIGSRPGIETLRNSGVFSVTIDDSLGVGPAAPNADNEIDAVIDIGGTGARRKRPPTPSDFAPARPRLAIGQTRGSLIGSVTDTIKRDRAVQRGRQAR